VKAGRHKSAPFRQEFLRFSGNGTKHRSRKNGPVLMADHHTECDGCFDEATAVARTRIRIGESITVAISK